MEAKKKVYFDLKYDSFIAFAKETLSMDNGGLIVAMQGKNE